MIYFISVPCFSQDMQEMRNCYDSLLSAAAATANSAYGTNSIQFHFKEFVLIIKLIDRLIDGSFSLMHMSSLLCPLFH